MSVNFYWSDTHRSSPKERKDKPKGVVKVWFFKSTIEFADGSRKRVSGTPGVVGPYQHLPQTKEGAQTAEDLAKHEARYGKERVEKIDEQKADVLTVAEFAPTFVESYAPRDDKPRSRSSRDQILKSTLIPFFGSMPMDSIAQLDVDTYVKARKKKVGLKTINNELGVLSALLGYAADNPKLTALVAPPSLRLIVADKDSEDRDIVPVKESDVAKLVSAATDPRYRAAILLASEAGLRIGEIRGLQQGDCVGGRLVIRRAIDTKNNITTPKSGRHRKVPISDRLAAALALVPRRGAWVISKKDGESLGYDAMREKIHEIYKAAGVEVPASETGETMPWHSLRHTFGSVSARRGVPIPQLQKLMGHRKFETTLRYVTVSDDDLDSAIALAFGRSPSQVSTTVRGNVRNEMSADSSTVN